MIILVALLLVGETAQWLGVAGGRLVNLDERYLAQGCPNRNPEHERK